MPEFDGKFLPNHARIDRYLVYFPNCSLQYSDRSIRNYYMSLVGGSDIFSQPYKKRGLQLKNDWLVKSPSPITFHPREGAGNIDDFILKLELNYNRFYESNHEIAGRDPEALFKPNRKRL